MIELIDIKGVGSKTIHKLNELGIYNIFDLMSVFPTKYINLKKPISVTNAEIGHFSLFEGKVEKVGEVAKRKHRAFSVSFSDLKTDNKIYFKATFYNQPYLANNFNVGDKFRLLAKLSKNTGRFEIVNPIYQKFSDNENNTISKSQKLEGIYTIYPTKGIIGQNTYKKFVYNALELISDAKLSGNLASINNEFVQNFQQIHKPITIEKAEKAISQIAGIDLGIALTLYQKGQKYSKKQRNVLYFCDKSRILDVFAENFKPTKTQLDAFNEIENDLKTDKTMSRIICGDVGSGKTLVAFFAMLYAILSNHQTALLAPTEILAVQHANSFKFYADKFNIKYTVLTSKTKTAEKKIIYQRLKNGEIDCVFGTQSILNDDIEYKDLSLAVIDEQHKFGVFDRAKLENKGAKDVLSLTATPIPRSMALTFYKNIDISKIEKRKEAKTNIKTLLVDDNNLEKTIDFCIENSLKGEQSFIVCPSIVDSEGFDVFSLQTFIKMYQNTLNKVPTSVIYGKLSNDEKNSIMQEFKNKTTSIMLSTTVIEVGIDTLANNILILNADRFGLATLHQLRGRIGRDGRKSTCFLHTNTQSEKAMERLKSVCNINDGQKLAEIDFDTRGAGEFLGTKQSGTTKTPIFGLNLTTETLINAKIFADKYNYLTIKELSALTRKSKSKMQDFLNMLDNITLNS